MSKDPAVLFYTSDFLTGTAFLSMEQRGQYITLLCEQHQNGHIPEEHMINICKTYDSPVLNKFIKDERGLYYNVRMEEEHQKRISYSLSRSNNRKGKEKSRTHEKHMSSHMENENENEDLSFSSLKKPKKAKFVKPTLEEVAAYCLERKNGIDPQRFLDSNDAKGWVVGKNQTPMRDWKAVIRTWEANKSKNDNQEKLAW